MTTQIQEHTSGLKHGQFKVNMPLLEGGETVEHVVHPLSQEDLANGWQLKLPSAHKNSTIHHFSVYLSQLPPNLWKSVIKVYSDEGDYYRTINDGIYQYSIKMSKYDDDLRKLYKLVMMDSPDRHQVYQLYEHLEQQRVKGWIMIRAKKLLGL